MVKQNKVGAVVAGIGAAAAVGGTMAYKAIAKKRREKVESEDIKIFKKTLDRYLSAIRKGKMAAELIDEMSNALTNLKMLSMAADIIKIEITLEQLSDVISTINEYTQALARNNNFELDKEELFTDKNDKFIDFQNCLIAQKRTFEQAA